VREFLGVFGDEDALVIFEAPDEGTAADSSPVLGALATQTAWSPVESYKWTAEPPD